MQVVALIMLAAVLFFGLKTDAPSPEKSWQPYAVRKETGKAEWTYLSSYKSYDECKFIAEKSIQGSSYQNPSGCLYSGYQNPYVQWLVNSFVGNGMFRCIARMKNRDRYEDVLYSPVLRDYPADHNENWECVLKG